VLVKDPDLAFGIETEYLRRTAILDAFLRFTAGADSSCVKLECVTCDGGYFVEHDNVDGTDLYVDRGTGAEVFTLPAGR
jgi:hypothetical protein